MRYLSILFIVLLMGCVQAQTPTNPYNLNFNLNTDGITAEYEVMWYNGTDTLMTDSLQFSAPEYFSHDSLESLYGVGSQAALIDIFPSLEDGQNLIAAMRAIGINGRNSGWAYSPYYTKADNRAPGIPQLPFISR